MHNMLMKMPNMGNSFVYFLFPSSLLGPRSKTAAVNCGLIQDRLSEPARAFHVPDSDLFLFPGACVVFFFL